MAITPQQMRDLMVAHGLGVKPVNGSWYAEKDGRELRRSAKPLPEDAIEVAVAVIVETQERAEAARKSRLFELLESGFFYGRSRLITETGPDGNPMQVRVWDIFRTSNNNKLIDGERSLVAAVLAAEAILAAAQQQAGQAGSPQP